MRLTGVGRDSVEVWSRGYRDEGVGLSEGVGGPVSGSRKREGWGGDLNGKGWSKGWGRFHRSRLGTRRRLESGNSDGMDQSCGCWGSGSLDGSE